MKKLNFFLYLLVILSVCACHHKNQITSYDKIGSSGLTTRTEFLRANLKMMSANGIMIGHENSTVEGIGWRGDSAQSDIKSCCDDYPAVLSFELSGIEQDTTLNSDSISFSLIRRAILDQFKRGGINMLTWSVPLAMDNLMEEFTKRAATYLNSLQDPYGIKAPILLVLNITSRDPKVYQNYWQKVITSLKKQGINNVLYVFSGDIKCYPGDKDVDIIEASYIQSTSDSRISDYNIFMENKLKETSDFAEAHQKVIGVRTGLSGIPSKDFWTETLLPLFKPYRITYVVLGKNKGDRTQDNYCAPFPGEHSIANFVKFYNDKKTLFMSDINGLYLDHTEKSYQ